MSSTLKLLVLTASLLSTARGAARPTPGMIPTAAAAEAPSAATCSATPAPAPRRVMPWEEGCADAAPSSTLAQR